MVFWIQKGAYLLIVFHRLKGMCKNPLFIFALIFIKKLFWFCIRFFLITIIFSPHVLIAILTRAFSLICTISSCTNLYYLLSTDDRGVFAMIAVFLAYSFLQAPSTWVTVLVTFFYYILSPYRKKTQAVGVERDVPEALQLKSRKAWNACCPCPGQNRLYLWKQWGSALSYR